MARSAKGLRGELEREAVWQCCWLLVNSSKRWGWKTLATSVDYRLLGKKGERGRCLIYMSRHRCYASEITQFSLNGWQVDEWCRTTWTTLSESEASRWRVNFGLSGGRQQSQLLGALNVLALLGYTVIYEVNVSKKLVSSWLHVWTSNIRHRRVGSEIPSEHDHNSRRCKSTRQLGFRGR